MGYGGTWGAVQGAVVSGCSPGFVVMTLSGAGCFAQGALVDGVLLLVVVVIGALEDGVPAAAQGALVVAPAFDSDADDELFVAVAQGALVVGADVGAAVSGIPREVLLLLLMLLLLILLWC